MTWSEGKSLRTGRRRDQEIEREREIERVKLAGLGWFLPGKTLDREIPPALTVGVPRLEPEMRTEGSSLEAEWTYYREATSHMAQTHEGEVQLDSGALVRRGSSSPQRQNVSVNLPVKVCKIGKCQKAGM